METYLDWLEQEKKDALRYLDNIETSICVRLRCVWRGNSPNEVKLFVKVYLKGLEYEIKKQTVKKKE